MRQERTQNPGDITKRLVGPASAHASIARRATHLSLLVAECLHTDTLST